MDTIIRTGLALALLVEYIAILQPKSLAWGLLIGVPAAVIGFKVLAVNKIRNDNDRDRRW